MDNQPHDKHEVLLAIRRILSTRPFAGADGVISREQIVAATSRLPVSNLERWEQQIRMELRQARSAFWAKWKFWKKKRSPMASWLDVCSDDGYRREKALLALSEDLEEAPNGFFFALALRRLNDWVPQVRTAAREHLPLVAKRSDPNKVVDALWVIIPNSTSWERLRDEYPEALTDIFAIKQVAFALKSRIILSPVGPAASILARVGRTSVLDSWLGEIAENAVQPAVRAKAYRFQLDGQVTWTSRRLWMLSEPVAEQRPVSIAGSIQEVLSAAIDDPSPKVRRVGGDFLIRELKSIGPDSRRLAEVLASDRYPSIADRGRYVLKKLSKTRRKL